MPTRNTPLISSQLVNDLSFVWGDLFSPVKRSRPHSSFIHFPNPPPDSLHAAAAPPHTASSPPHTASSWRHIKIGQRFFLPCAFLERRRSASSSCRAQTALAAFTPLFCRSSIGHFPKSRSSRRCSFASSSSQVKPLHRAVFCSRRFSALFLRVSKEAPEIDTSIFAWAMPVLDVLRIDSTPTGTHLRPNSAPARHSIRTK
ncbi:hypothetical protein KSP39_PZI005758 [Platanthera zijinensis]|uniref:Uncharacterized protein n=1 Tax=Platanthera zijinensis TaxID=2320716 RepID=A0AAP0GBN3_9ASPA